jgi:hypothetical protein
MSHHSAHALRQRARHLRQLATEIERSPVLSLHLHAGEATWRGTHPQFCLNLLRTRQARLRNDVDDLRWHADLLEQRAAKAEHLAVLHAGHVR